MVTFPKEFIAIKHPGYFWNINDRKLYSIKVTGVLKPLAKRKVGFISGGRFHYDSNGETGYQISVGGRKQFITVKELNALKPKNSVVPVYKHQLPLI